MVTANKEEELLEIIGSFEEGKYFNIIAKKNYRQRKNN